MENKFFKKVMQASFFSLLTVFFAFFLFSGSASAMYYPMNNYQNYSNYSNNYGYNRDYNNRPSYEYNRPNYYTNYYTGMPMPNYPNQNYNNYSTFLNYMGMNNHQTNYGDYQNHNYNRGY